MVETELRKLIEDMVAEMVKNDNWPKPHITKNLNTEPISEQHNNNVEGGCIDDITEIDLKKLLLVENPKNREEYGKKWRCWAENPTEEERKAAEWD